MSLRSAFAIAWLLAAPALAQPSGGAAPASGAPVVIDQSAQFATADGQSVLIAPGNYVLEISAAPPLRLRGEWGEPSYALQAQAGRHGETLAAAVAESIPGDHEHHLVLLLPGGASLDAVGSYDGVIARDAAPVASDAITRFRAQQDAWLSGAGTRDALEPRPEPQKPEHTVYDEGLFRDRLIVKFRDGSSVRTLATRAEGDPPTLGIVPTPASENMRERLQRSDLTPEEIRGDVTRSNDLLRGDTVRAWRPLFDRDTRFLDVERRRAELATGTEQADLTGFYTVAMQEGKTGEALADQFNGLESVEIAYLAPIPVVAQTATPVATPDWEPQQNYLDAATTGIDARYAWTLPGGRGAGIKVIDVESGWNLAHEDLPRPFVVDGVVEGDATCAQAARANADDCKARWHGTAVLGELVGIPNGRGVTGIVSDALFGVVSAIRKHRTWYTLWIGTREVYSVAEALNAAASRLSRGDVLLIEQHSQGPSSGQTCSESNHNVNPPCNCSQWEYIAMEYWGAEYDAIRAATGRGVHVVEAAGNGGMDLDDARYGRRFDRTFRDSGAIVVGASDSNRDPACFTNFGSRVDVHAWGRMVMTTGYGTPAAQRIAGTADNRWYRRSFGGTSSASPIVTGAVASLMGIQRAAGQQGMTPLQMRKLLRDTGSAQNTSTRQIGPLPDLKAALATLTLEDCLPVEHEGVSVAVIDYRTTVVQGDNQLIEFGSNTAAAQQAVKAIQHYKLSRHCFIGRPAPSFEYWLVGDQAPSGALEGEVCSAFDPAQLRVMTVGGRYQIQQDSRAIADFAGNEIEAQAALRRIQKYGFTQRCVFERTAQQRVYWRR